MTTNLDINLEQIDLLLFWGKHGKTRSDKYHPLLYHMFDVASVAYYIWCKILPRQIKDQFINCLKRTTPMIDDQVGGCLWALWAGFHDIGKCSPFFQLKWEEMRPIMIQWGLTMIGTTEVKHGTISAAILQKIYQMSATNWAKVIGGHHGIFPSSEEIKKVRLQMQNTMNSKKWTQFQNELINHMMKLFPIETQMQIIPSQLPIWLWMVLAGGITIADWIGSSTNYFPYASDILSIEDYTQQLQKKVEEAIESIGWNGWIPSNRFISFNEMFPFISQIRPLQQQAIDLDFQPANPVLIIIEAPMGEGKTEAAMYLADKICMSQQNAGLYFGLPTQATSNQMFTRVKEFLANRFPHEIINLNLVHGHAVLSTEFDKLKDRYNFLLSISQINDKDGLDGAPAEIVASEWFTHKKISLLSPFGVGTVDQLLMAVLQTKHFFLRLFGIAGKVIIIDEVHAYDAYMLGLIELLLQWLAVLQSSVILLSATISRDRRVQLLTAYMKGLNYSQSQIAESNFTPLKETIPFLEYPRITWIDKQGFNGVHFPATRSMQIEIKWLDGMIHQNRKEEFPFVRELKEKLSDGGHIAIICNTVVKSQRIYQYLQDYFQNSHFDAQIILFHAHYRFLERDIIEKKVLSQFGKHNEERKNHTPIIVVATQVIEQSLDLDFDLLITEIAPIDLILQRSGRLHRFAFYDEHRPKWWKIPHVWILKPEIKEQIPHFGNDVFVYDEYILLKTWIHLQNRSTIQIPGEIENLIENVYGSHSSTENLPISNEMKLKIELTYKKLQEKQHNYCSLTLQNAILPPSEGDKLIDLFNRELEEDRPDVHKSLQALTRISGPSVSIVLLYENELNMTSVEDLLKRAIHLSSKKYFNVFKDIPSPPEWLKNPYLRFYKLLRINNQGEIVIDKTLLHYNSCLGLYD